jgi:hypothetical protein
VLRLVPNERSQPRAAGGAVGDAALFAGSALVALVIPLTTEVPLDRQWAAEALPGYAIGALGAALLSRRANVIWARTVLTLAVFVAVAVLPMLLQASVRVRDARAPVKSDVLVVEEAAEFLLDGRNPYRGRFDGGLLTSWPEPVASHFPYLPATLALGVPRQAWGASLWSDPRVVSLVVTLVVVGSALAASRAPGDGRLRAFQVLLVLPCGAPLVFTSGKELPVLALLLASLVALERERPLVGGLAMGLAASTHQLAWAMFPLAVLAAGRAGRPRHRSAAFAAGLTTLVILAPFVAWDAAAFLDDTVRYPAGMNGSGGVPLAPGSILGTIVPGARGWLLAALVVVLPVLTVALSRWIGTSPTGLAQVAGVLLVAAFVLAPRIRIAYLVFPLNLIVWSRLVLGGGDRGGSASARAASDDEPLTGGDGEEEAGEERPTSQGAWESIPLAGQPDMEDQDDRHERRVAAQGGSDDAATRLPGVLNPDSGSVTASPEAPPREEHHRAEHDVGGDQRRQDGPEHGHSTSEEEAPPSDEQVPSEP